MSSLGKLRQQVQTGIPRSEIIYRRQEAPRPVGAKNQQEMGRFRDFFVLGHFEDDVGQRPTNALGGSERDVQTMLGVADGIGHEGDGEERRRLRLHGAFERPDPAGLVEDVPVGRVDR
jgi:hypothetical protein